MSKYDYDPRPNIEQHHHIRDLIEAQEKRADDRTYHREKVKTREEREQLIADARPAERVDFLCSCCKTEFSCLAIKQVEIDWSNDTQRVAFYKSKCRKCGNWCIRLVTDRHKDGYWMRSRFVSLQRGQFHNDLIQPHEENFNLLYGKR